MNRLCFSVLAALTLLVPQSAVRAAPVPGGGRSGLEQVPATAPIVVHVRGVQGSRDRLVAMMENALPDVLKKFQPQMDEFLKNGYRGRKLRGLKADGPIFLVFTELPKANEALPDPPPFAVVAAVSNYKEFHDNILTEEERKNAQDKGNGLEAVKIENESNPTYFLDRKTYAVITPNEETAKLFSGKIKKGLDQQLSKEQTAKLLGGDLSVYVNMEFINKNYGEQIKEAKEGIQNALNPLESVGDDSQKKIVEAFKKAIGPVFQAVEDMDSFVATIEMRPGGLGLHLETGIRKTSPTANLLQDSKPVALKEMEKLPAGRAYYSAMKTSSALYQGLGSLMVGIPLGKGGEDSKEVAAALEELAKAGPTVRLDGFAFPLSGLQVVSYDDPARALKAQTKLYKIMAESDPKSTGLREKAVLKMDAEKFGDFKLHSVQLAWDFEKMAEPIAQQGEAAKKQYIETMKKLLGDKTMMWFGTDGKVVVVLTAPKWEEARKLLEQYSTGMGTVGDNKAFRDARKEMPAQTSFLGLIDVVHLMGTMVEAFRPLIPGGQLPPGWPNMPAKGTMSFVGLSVTLEPQRGSFDLFITAAAAQEFYKAVVKPLVGE